VFLSVVGGAISFYAYITEKPDYGLMFAIDEQSQIIENKNGVDDLKIIYKDIEVKSLFGTKVIITNIGEKAIAKDLIFTPLKISVQSSNSLINVNTKHPIKSIKNEITVDIDLLNPNEHIEFYILTTELPIFSLSYKIREITEILIWNKLTDPPLDKKFFDINWLWFLFLITSIMGTIDAIFLIKEDRKLSEIFGFISDIQFDKNFNKEQMIDKLSFLYNEYSNSLPFMFLDADFLIKEVSNKIDSIDTSSERELYQLYEFTTKLVRHGNLYDMRTMNMFAGPLIFIGSFLGIIFNLIF
jgi:hypothetical protein